MAAKIKTPQFLIYGNITALNDKLLSKIRAFAFLGEEEEMLNGQPSTFREAFEPFVSRLYRVYHELGTVFLDCFCNEISGSGINNSFIPHILFVKNCRSAIQHSGNAGGREHAFTTLKNYVFKSGSFTFTGWSDFYMNADESHWKTVVETIVRDSDRLYYALCDTADPNGLYSSAARKVSVDFTSGVYTQTDNGRKVDMYRKAINGRFLTLIRNSLLNKNRFPGRQDDAKDELWSLIHYSSYVDKRTEAQKRAGKKTPAEIVDAVINVIKGDLQGKDSFDFRSETLYQDIEDTVEGEIKNQLKANDKALTLSLV